MSKNFGILALSAVWCVATSQQAKTGQQGQDLTKLGIEDLMKIEVTTASKEAQTLSHVPAAIYVVTQDDIRRSGATCIPEALRGVPGVQVARIDANQWIVSIRGFDSRFANKLLVLIDGRSIYEPIYAGVFWDAPEVNMDDIDRIEVIRGPGGTLWGTNAVNGIINVITKKASETQGSTLKLGGSTNDANSAQIENGGKLGPNAFYRVYAKYFDVESFPSTAGDLGDDKWKAIHAGFRTDWNTKSDAFTVSGGLNNSHEGQTSRFPIFTPPYTEIVRNYFPVSNWDVLAHWDRTAGASKGTSFQISVDHSNRAMPEAALERDTLAMDFSQPIKTNSRNRMMWGLGYNRTWDRTNDSRLTDLEPSNDQEDVFSGFIQDELTLSRNLQLSLGTKIEHQDISGWQLQPSGRLTWQRNPKETFWAAVSRAVRTPTRAETDSTTNSTVMPPSQGSLPMEIRVIGNPNLKAETVVADEIGWRYVPSERLSIDATAYYNRYDNLVSLEPLTPFMENLPIPHLVLPYSLMNGGNAETAGFELASQYQVNPRWRLKSGLTLFSARYFGDATSHDPNTGPSAGGKGSTPGHQFNLSSLVDLTSKVQWDTNFYFVDKVAVGSIPAYGRLDMRLGWRPSASFECSFGVQNLLTTKHREAFSSFIEVPAFIERNFYVTATLRF